jgi:hypothetical protein
MSALFSLCIKTCYQSTSREKQGMNKWLFVFNARRCALIAALLSRTTQAAKTHETGPLGCGLAPMSCV